VCLVHVEEFLKVAMCAPVVQVRMVYVSAVDAARLQDRDWHYVCLLSVGIGELDAGAGVLWCDELVGFFSSCLYLGTASAYLGLGACYSCVACYHPDLLHSLQRGGLAERAARARESSSGCL
jgi:hypothetical protein